MLAKMIKRMLIMIGALTVLGMAGVALAVALLWWQDRQWQASASREEE